VFVTLPARMASQLHVMTYPALGGTGGRPGRGGKNGMNPGGTAVSAADGGAAEPGEPGRDGVRRPAPEVFVNGRPLAGRTTSP